MDKKEATNFVILGIQNQLTQQEIVKELSIKLGAPQEVVHKFVSRVITEYQLEPSIFTKNSYVATKEVNNMSYQNTISREKKRVDQINSFEDLSIPKRTEFQNPHLEKMILDRLTKSSKDADVVMAVCEQTGMSWKDAERLVAQVRQRNHKKLVTRQNLLVVPLAIIALLAGLALIIASISEGYKLALSIQSGEIPSIENGARQIPWALATGFILILGGGTGLIWALKEQLQ